MDEAPFLAGGGEMGARMRALNWSRTPLGAPDAWPQSLRTAIGMMLPSKAQIILFWGPEFAVLYNDPYRPVFGAKHPHALGRAGREAWSEIWESQLHTLLAGVLRTGEAFTAKDLLFVLARHGFVEETYFDVSYDPVRIESGEVGGVYCIVTETTGRVVGERRLALLRDLAARNATARSAREACVLAMETLAAKPQDVPYAAAYLEGEMQACTPGTRPELVKELPIGTTGTLVVGLNPRRPFDDQYRAFLDLVADQLATAIANAQAYEEERKRAEALAAIDRAKTAFFSNVSHEFRTPLTLMLGPVADGLADREHPLPPAQRERQEMVLRSALRLQKLVNTLLDFSRIEAGRAQASYAPTDLAGFTANLASTFRSAVEKAGLEFGVDCPPLAEPAYIDREMWEKIVLNLISNAFKFTFEGGITVSLRLETDFVLEVRDTGTGIPAAELPRIFERFRRVEGAKSRTYEGTGIGLALVRELVKLHGGTVRADSTQGRGSAFTVRIPRGREHLPQERVGAPAALASTALGPASYVQEALGWLAEPEISIETYVNANARPRIVWADDNVDMREYVKSLLAPRYEVEAAGDGEAALAAVRQRRPDLVLSDVMMPKLDGLGLARALRADPSTRGIPVMLLSARAGEEARIEGLDAGADDYLQKPFSGRELLARIAARLELAGLQRELELADRRKDEFLAMLSHELRNPLAPIRNAVSLLQEADDDAQLAAQARGILERQVSHLIRLVDDLLDITRISHGQISLQRRVVPLAQIVAAAVETSRPLFDARAHQLLVRAEPAAATVLADPVRLAQVIANLLNNAARYTPERGRIELEVHAADGSASISVRDNGIGIAREELPRLFEMFTQGEATRRFAPGGLGIGLALARQLAELHGGTLEARSEGPGRGAAFILRVPLCAPHEREAPATETFEPGAVARRILVVDDNADAAEGFAAHLRRRGHEVRIATDGERALAIAREFEPQVALVDIALPGMSGYELAHRLRATPALLIALTGHGQKEDRTRAEAAGFHHHFVKPADPREIEATIGAWQAS